jgi:hypothetical protein
MIHPKKKKKKRKINPGKKPMESWTKCKMGTKVGCLNRVVDRRTKGW